MCFCLLGCVGGGCPEGRGTWNIKPCHGSSAQPWALSCSGSLSGVEVAAGVAQVWKRFLSSLLFSLLGHTTPLHVQAGGNVYVTLLLESRTLQKGKLAYEALVWPCSSREQKELKHFGRGMQITRSCSVPEQSLECRREMCNHPFWTRPKIITVGTDAKLFSAAENWAEKQQTNRLYITENHQKKATSVVTPLGRFILIATPCHPLLAGLQRSRGQSYKRENVWRTNPF